MSKERKRLIRFRNFLDKHIKDDEFNFNNVVSATNAHGCGTVCCAIGWLPKFNNREFGWRLWQDNHTTVFCKKSGERALRHSHSYFGMSYSDFVDLFMFGNEAKYYSHCEGRIQRGDVITAINKYIAEHKDT